METTNKFQSLHSWYYSHHPHFKSSKSGHHKTENVTTIFRHLGLTFFTATWFRRSYDLHFPPCKSKTSFFNYSILFTTSTEQLIFFRDLGDRIQDNHRNSTLRFITTNHSTLQNYDSLSPLHQSLTIDQQLKHPCIKLPQEVELHINALKTRTLEQNPSKTTSNFLTTITTNNTTATPKENIPRHTFRIYSKRQAAPPTSTHFLSRRFPFRFYTL